MPKNIEPREARAVVLAVHRTEDALPPVNELVMTDRSEMYLNAQGVWCLDDFIEIAVDPPLWWVRHPAFGTMLDKHESRALITAMGYGIDGTADEIQDPMNTFQDNLESATLQDRFMSLHDRLASELPPKHLWGA